MDDIEQIESEQCRTCYNSRKSLKLLNTLTKCSGSRQQKSYAELLKEVSNINTVENLYGDKLPQLICQRCIRRLKTAYTFIQQTRNVNERLLNIAGKVEASELQKSLQEEPSIDVLATEDMKSEKEDDEIDYLELFDSQSLAYLKVENPDHNVSLESNTTTDDVLSLQKDEPLVEVKLSSEKNTPTKDTSEDIVFSNDELDTENDWRGQEDVLENVKKTKKKNILHSKKCSYNADDDIAVPCSECSKIFCNSKELARHKRNSHIPEEQKCTCSLCDRKFSRSCNMYKHMRTFHGPDSVTLLRKPLIKERIFQCDKCERNYKKKSYLNVHVKEKHSNQENKTEMKPEQTESSDKNPVGDDDQKNDIPKKRNEIRSLCSICGISFSRKTHLVIHMRRRHTGERPFKCDLCECAYPRPSELVSHRRIHTGEKPYTCKICDKAFRVWSKMRKHMSSHSDIRPYKCIQCERSFKYSNDLNIHFRKHTGERPYKCNVCGSTFTQSNTLKAHRSKMGHMDDNAITAKSCLF